MRLNLISFKTFSLIVSSSYLGIEELPKVEFNRLREDGWEGVVFESSSLVLGEVAWFEVVDTDVGES